VTEEDPQPWVAGQRIKDRRRVKAGQRIEAWRWVRGGHDSSVRQATFSGHAGTAPYRPREGRRWPTWTASGSARSTRAGAPDRPR